MPAITMLIKPASSSCNLRCKYCFYYDTAENRDIANYGIMKEDTLEAIVKKAFEYGEYHVGFAFQGGEPTLAGLDFFKTFIKLQNQYNTNGIKVQNSLQTNGVAIDENWAKFLSENRFLVGLSLDGPKDIHDLNRIDVKGTGSFRDVMRAARIMDKYKVEYNILTVVTKPVARHVQKVYGFFAKEGFHYMQFIPCLDHMFGEHGTNPYSLTPKMYGEFLIKLFDLWYKDFKNGRMVSIRMFDNILQILSGHRAESCDMNGICSVNTVIEADGSIYPCDFYVLDDYRMGNIKEDTLDSVLSSEIGKNFVEKSISIRKECDGCEFFSICRGGCQRHYDTTKEIRTNYFCASYKMFYGYSLPKFQEVLRILAGGRSRV
ncbi:anaerobic sulfatase maturase [Alkalibacter saccharofermentans]|uniref:Radical SAM core domain-containing protein n=1 Tax=Alkalibacter saccharofermentans DSM 14828 TaxID=1120975 RepID=A0A1M4U6E4_9FIRM|nr:anaerobic sulfatase maturase [Alkalibacter saccharofermentans]SHE52218.1 uncharacterized protein SAMN02746064_00657 [Alkalibacter saccharofermentans DSM 14828]